MAETEAEPTLDGLIATMMAGGQMAGGWDGVTTAGEAMSKNRKEYEAAFIKEARIFKNTFQTEDGQKCLQILLNMTLRRSAWPAEMRMPLDVLTALGIAREAQNGLVSEIVRAIASANDEDIQGRNEE